MRNINHLNSGHYIFPNLTAMLTKQLTQNRWVVLCHHIHFTKPEHKFIILSNPVPQKRQSQLIYHQSKIQDYINLSKVQEEERYLLRLWMKPLHN